MVFLRKYINLPNLLTLLRLLISPLLLPVLIVYLLPYDYIPFNILLAVLFMAFSFTDFLDGYFARKYHLTTKLGGSLDHIADKFLTYSAFIGLVTINKIYFFWVIIFIGRDFFVMGLRQIALENNFSVPVGLSGKIKTMLQMMLITWLIARPVHLADSWYYLEISLLSAAVLTTLASAYQYYLGFIKEFEMYTVANELSQSETT